MSKNFLPLSYFAVDHVLPISEYDLENGRMPFSKNIELKIW